MLDEKAVLESKNKAVCRDEAHKLRSAQEKISLEDCKECEAVRYEIISDCDPARADSGGSGGSIFLK